MTKFVLSIATLLLMSFSIMAQNTVQLNINHKLGTDDFAMNTAAQNNMANDFNISRLQYYIAEISIVHDGGTETAITDLYALVDANNATQLDLGSHSITSIEGVNFHIGVDAGKNHADPASYSMSHPLAPKNPSMHWGWTSGYRFIAMEGNGGANLNQTFELHGLGDANYFKVTVPFATAMTATNNEFVLNVDADYTRILENVNVSSGLIVHGETGAAKTETTIVQAANPLAGMPQLHAPAPVAAAPATSIETPAATEASDENANYITVKSPIIGTFYRKPSPDKPNFVEVGSAINTGDTVCVIEAMKLFNEIESEVSGKIVKVLVDDASPVEFDQPLFLVDPS